MRPLTLISTNTACTMSKSNLRMSWAGDYSSLQEFVEDKLCLVGKWSSIGGEKKQFEGGNIVINWWKNKKYLAISGEKASEIVCRLTTLFTDT